MRFKGRQRALRDQLFCQVERNFPIIASGAWAVAIDVSRADGGCRPAVSEPVEEHRRSAAAPGSFFRLLVPALSVPSKWIERLAHGLPSRLFAAIAASSGAVSASLPGSRSTSGPTFLVGASITITSSLLPPAVKSMRMEKRSAVGAVVSGPIAAVCRSSAIAAIRDLAEAVLSLKISCKTVGAARNKNCARSLAHSPLRTLRSF